MYLKTKHVVLIQELSIEIRTTHEARLDRRHPETIKSLLWPRALLVMEEGLEKLIDTGLERLRDESVRRKRLAESLHSENKFAAVILDLMAQIKPRLAMRALEIVRSTSDTIAQLPEKSSGEGDHPLLRGDLPTWKCWRRPTSGQH